jgi:hypothetical protein
MTNTSDASWKAAFDNDHPVSVVAGGSHGGSRSRPAVSPPAR